MLGCSSGIDSVQTELEMLENGLCNVMCVIHGLC